MNYSKGDKVLSSSKWSNGQEGVVHNVNDRFVSVNFGTKEKPSYQRFHFKPVTHHTQTHINDLELLEKFKTLKNE